MIILELESEEQAALLQLIESRLGEIHPEIRRSQTTSFREELKHEEAILHRLADRLRPVSESHA
jgi:hypothetical protein